jgi:hypothetical protein
MDFITLALGFLVVGVASWTVAAALANRAPHRAHFLTAAVAALGMGLLATAFGQGEAASEATDGTVPGLLARIDPMVLFLFGCLLYCLLTLVRWWRMRR